MRGLAGTTGAAHVTDAGCLGLTMERQAMTLQVSSGTASRSGGLARLGARGRALALGAGLAIATVPVLAAAAPLPDSFAPLVDKVLPAVVTIATTQVQSN